VGSAAPAALLQTVFAPAASMSPIATGTLFAASRSALTRPERPVRQRGINAACGLRVPLTGDAARRTGVGRGTPRSVSGFDQGHGLRRRTVPMSSRFQLYRADS